MLFVGALGVRLCGRGRDCVFRARRCTAVAHDRRQRPELCVVARRLELDLDVQSMPWKRCLAQVEVNALDGVFAVSYQSERENLGVYPGGGAADVSKRLHSDSYMLIRKKGSAVRWDGRAFSSLNGVIGCQLGYSICKHLRKPNVAVDEGSQKADELVQKLLARRLAATAPGGGEADEIMRGAMAGELEMVSM